MDVSQLPDNAAITLPHDVFIAPAHLEDTVVLETAIDNTRVVEPADLAAAWSELSAVSVEAALANRPDVYDFANNHCLLFAALRSPIKAPFALTPAIEKLGLPLHNEIASHDSPIVLDNPVILTQEFREARRRERETMDADPPTPTDTTPPEKQPLNSEEHPPSEYESPNSPTIMQWRTIGLVYVTMSSIPREVYVGVYVFSSYRSRGYGMRACALAVQWAIETIDAHRVQARIMSSSTRDRTQRLFTALGFAHEGIQRRAVIDAAGAWADITHMGILDVDWVVRKRGRAAPRSMWDELFERHQREREELLRWEANEGRPRTRRTSSMETVRLEPDVDPYSFSPSCWNSDASSCADTDTRSPSPVPSSSSASSASSQPHPPSAQWRNHSGFDVNLESGWRGHPLMSESEEEEPFSDTEWVMDQDSYFSALSGEPVSRPLSAASWSSYDSVRSAASSSSGVQSVADA